MTERDPSSATSNSPDSGSSTLVSRLRDIYRTPQTVYAALRENGGEWYDWIVPTLLAATFWAAPDGGLPVDPQDGANWETLTEEERQMARDAAVMWRSHFRFPRPLIKSLASLSASALLLVPLFPLVPRP